MEDPTSSEVTAAASSKTARAVAASDAAAAPTAGAGDDERIDGVPLVDAGAEARDGRVCGAGGGVPGDPTVAQGVIGGGENFGGCDLGGNEPDEGAGGATTASDMDVEEGAAGPQAHHRKAAARSLRLAPVDGRPRLNLNGPHCVSIDRLWVERASYAYLTNRTPRPRLFLDDRAAPRQALARDEAPATRPSKSAVERSDAGDCRHCDGRGVIPRGCSSTVGPPAINAHV